MKFDSKRIISILLTLVLIFGMAGCKNKVEDNSSDFAYGWSEDNNDISNSEEENSKYATSSDKKNSSKEKESSSKVTSSNKSSGSGNSTSKNENATKEFVPVLRFVVASDVHITNTTNVNAQRLEKLFASSFRYASNSKNYKKLDAVVFVGDFTDNGLKSEYNAFDSIVSKATENQKTKVICSMGNHECYKGTAVDFINMTGNDLNQDITINGFHFITMSPEKGAGEYNSNTLSWFFQVLLLVLP